MGKQPRTRSTEVSLSNFPAYLGIRGTEWDPEKSRSGFLNPLPGSSQQVLLLEKRLYISGIFGKIYPTMPHMSVTIFYTWKFPKMVVPQNRGFQCLKASHLEWFGVITPILGNPHIEPITMTPIPLISTRVSASDIGCSVSLGELGSHLRPSPSPYLIMVGYSYSP